MVSNRFNGHGKSSYMVGQQHRLIKNDNFNVRFLILFERSHLV